MKKLVCVFLSVAAGLGTASGAVPKWETGSCDYWDLAKNITLSGRCHMQQTKINGNFGYLLTWPSGDKVTVEYVRSQSGNHIWNLNGVPAAAVEVTRENVHGFSLDLNQMLEWQDSP